MNDVSDSDSKQTFATAQRRTVRTALLPLSSEAGEPKRQTSVSSSILTALARLRCMRLKDWPSTAISSLPFT